MYAGKTLVETCVGKVYKFSSAPKYISSVYLFNTYTHIHMRQREGERERERERERELDRFLARKREKEKRIK